jgi:hypothetical protein
LKNTWIALICTLSFTASAQIGDYLGPGVLSRGAGDIGVRSGQQVDLRYYFDVSGVYDTGIQPFSVDSKGALVQINGLYGIQADFGAYGTHHWRRAQLGLDYRGNFYHYDNASFYDGSSHNLSLGYSYQKSRRLIIEVQGIAGTTSLGFGAPGFFSGVPVSDTTNVVNNPTTVLFDNRMYYFEPSMTVNYVQSARTIFSVGGEGYFVRRSATGLADMNGYNLHGTIRHRISKSKSVAVTYEHVHYDFPPAFGESDLNFATVSLSGALGRRWSYTVGGGVVETQVQGVQQVALNPAIAALLGVSFGQQTFSREDYYPNANISLLGRFKTYSISFNAVQTVGPGNGIYLTSQQRNVNAGYSYTGVKKFNFGLTAGYSELSSVGQGIQDYSNFSGGLGVTYNLTRAFHVIARADSRYQQIDLVNYNRTGYRVTFGLGFSPGNVPLSLW